MKFFFLLTLLFTVHTSALAEAEAELIILDNGLRVILEEMHFSPTVTVLIQYQVGAINETAEISGISHFTEHMMFNGTPDMPGSGFWQLVQKNGGRANGGTGTDQTTYFLYFPASKLEEGLRIEADRMQNCLMDSTAIAQEIGVVMDEWRLYQDSPDGTLYCKANEHFYGDHSLSRTILGTSETIASFNKEMVTDYYKTWYTPSNAILTVVGDFERDETLALIEEYFGVIPCDEAPEDNVPVITEWDFPERVDFDFPAESDRFLLYFRGCESTSPDIPALMLLSSYFSSGRIGWIEQDLINTGILTSGYASRPSGTGCKPFTFSGNVQNGVSADSAIELMTAEAYRLTEEPIGDDHLSLLQNYLIGREVMNSNTPLDKAYRQTYNLSGYDRLNAYEEMLDEMATLTPEEIQEVAARYFTPERLMVTVLHATEGGETARHTSSEGTTSTDVPEITDWSGLNLNPDEFELPDHSVSEGAERFQLTNGLTLLVKEDHSFPIVEMIVTLPMSDRQTEQEKAGISSLTSELMLRGTEELDYSEFHERLAAFGSGTWLSPGVKYTMGNVYGHSDYVETYFTSLSDLLIRPALREEDFQSVKDKAMGRLMLQNERPFYVFYMAMDEILLEEGNSRNADSTSLADLTHSDVAEWWETCVRPDGTVLAVVGDITPEQALALTEQYFGTWQNPNSHLPEIVEYQFSIAPGDTIITTMPGKIQIAEAVSCMAPSFESGDYIPFVTMSRILGGGIGSRLGQSIRETQGLAYVVGSMCDGTSNSFSTGSRFLAYLSTGADMARRALDAAVLECELITEEEVLEEELLLEQSRGLGRHALSYDNYDSVARYLSTTEFQNLSLTRDVDNLETVLSLNISDIQRVAEKYFTGEWFISVAGGVDQNMEPLE
ncbi:MAG: insulinase family protein [Candidatus Sabulitectum sp.]|nr:insulinase family protein [Candidatus Sabulitectum sp.]